MPILPQKLRHTFPLPWLMVEPFIEKHRRRHLFAPATVNGLVSWHCRFYMAQAFALAARFITRDPKSLFQLLHGQESSKPHADWIEDPEQLQYALDQLTLALQERVDKFTRLSGPPQVRCNSIHNFLGIVESAISVETPYSELNQLHQHQLETWFRWMLEDSVTVDEALEQAKVGALLGIGVGLFLPQLANGEMYFDHDMKIVLERVSASSQMIHPSNKDAEIATLGHLSYESFRKEPAIANRFGLDEYVSRWRTDKCDEIRHLIHANASDFVDTTSVSNAISEPSGQVDNQKGAKPFVSIREDPSCPIWPDHPAAVVDDQHRQGRIDVIASWRAGGDYSIKRDAESILRQTLGGNDERVRARLTTLLINRRIAGDRCPIVTKELIEEASNATDLADKTRANRLLSFLRTTVDAARFLANPSTYAPHIPFDSPQVIRACLAYSESTTPSELDLLLKYLASQGWIELPATNPYDSYEPIITLPGMLRTDIAPNPVLEIDARLTLINR